MRVLQSARTAPVRAAARLQAVQAEREAGMATAEYAVATVAACGFGGILYKVVTSETVLTLMTGLFKKALGSIF